MVHDVLLNDATAQAELIKNKTLTADELLTHCIEAIEKLNPELNAVINPLFDRARKRILELDKNAPFYGVPILLKDGIAAVKGEAFTNGSNMLKSFEPAYDSELVKRLEKAGFIIVGKTNMPEFGLLPTTEPQAFGATKNPWDVTKTPGGSSGGSAAAVAARMVAVAHGNDGGGSIRIPSSCCGLFGLKPSRGRIPLAPLSSLVGGLVEEHVLTRSVRDSAGILDHLSADDPFAFYKAQTKQTSFMNALSEKQRKLRIGYSIKTPFGRDIHLDCQKAVEEAVALCKSFGHDVEEKELDIPYNGKDLGELFDVLWSVGATTTIALFEAKTGQLPPENLVEPLSLALYKKAKQITGPQYELALQKMHKVARSIQECFFEYDVWISSSLAKPPVSLGEMKQDSTNPFKPIEEAAKFSPMTALFNISGQPAASVPLYWNEDNLPIGVQFSARMGNENTILQLAQECEQVIQWQNRLPGLILS